MIFNNNKDTIAELKKHRARRNALPKNYMQKQYERAEEAQNKIKIHNELMLKKMKEKHNG